MDHFPADVSISPRGDRARKIFFLGLLLAALIVVFNFVARDKMEIMLGLGVATVIGYILFRAPDLATLVFLFVLYANIAGNAVQSFGVPPIVGAGVSLLLALPFANYIILKRERIIFDQTFGLMLIHLIALVASALVAKDMNVALAAIFNYITEGLILYFLVVNVIRTLPALKRALWVLLAACSLLGSLSLYQEVTGDYENTFGGLAQRLEGLDSSEVDFEEFSGSRRAYGPLGSQNRYAQMMIVLLPFALCFYLSEPSPRSKFFALIGGLLTAGGMILTFSRGTFVTLAVLLVVIMFMGYIRPHKLIPGAVIALLLIGMVMPEYIERVSTVGSLTGLLSNETTGAREADGSLRGRYAETMAALNVFLEHPVIGVGPGQFFKFYSMKYGNEIGTKHLKKGRRAHNLYLEIAADTGIFGFVSFMAIVLLLLYQLWQAARHLRASRPELAHLATACVLALLAYLGTAMFLHLSYQRYYWLLIAMVSAALKIIRTEAEKENAKPIQVKPVIALNRMTPY